MRRLVVFWLILSAPTLAVIETYNFSDPELEARYHRLSQELRCPKCQNQNIADSNAPISRDLRALLHRKLEEGASDEEILDFMVARYGEFVRYRPAVDENTAVLWYAPFVLIAVGAVGLTLHLIGRRKVNAAPLTQSERRELLRKLEEAEQ